jgi:predicted porin
MKKSLFALAAVTAFAGAAQAQSSVTVYGLLDVGYIGGNSKAIAAGKESAETVSGISQSAQSSSRLGFRGTEDLGGGKSAFFTLETGLSPSNSTLSSFNNRQAFVGLAQKGLGRASIGTILTPLHVAVGQTSAGLHNNIIGDVIYPINTDIAPSDSTTNINAGYTVRTNNTINLQSDKVAGFQATAFYALKNKDQNQITNPTTGVVTGGTTNQNAYGIGLTYGWKNLLLAANYQSFKNETDSSSSATLAGRNATDNQMYLAAAYDFGILKAYAQYIDRKVTSNLNSNQYAKRSAQQLGVRANFTKSIQGWASVGTGRVQAWGLGEPTANFTGYQLGTSYALSKRTNLYGIFGSTNTSSVSSIASSANNSYSGNNYAIGVRHTF